MRFGVFADFLPRLAVSNDAGRTHVATALNRTAWRL